LKLLGARLLHVVPDGDPQPDQRPDLSPPKLLRPPNWVLPEKNCPGATIGGAPPSTAPRPTFGIGTGPLPSTSTIHHGRGSRNVRSGSCDGAAMPRKKNRVPPACPEVFFFPFGPARSASAAISTTATKRPLSSLSCFPSFLHRPPLCSQVANDEPLADHSSK